MSKPPLNNSNQIVAFMHCALCLGELKEAGLPVSPAEYARLSAGFTQRGFQLWCQRHQCNVINVDFEGAKHPADTTRKRD